MEISKDLLNIIQKGFALSLDGIHGMAHWKRVHDNGLRLAGQTGADRAVVTLFAYLHDSKRLDDGLDPDHGPRAAEYVQALQGSLIQLANADLELLMYACHYHSQPMTEADITVQTCWDSDRLDLGRIGIKPIARYLCTSAARQPGIIEWAYQRSQQSISPLQG